MANPAKVLNFFDIAGSWDASLAFVMGGALTVTFIGYHFTLKRSTPIVAPFFQILKRKDIDTTLLAGREIFGIGWGIAGFCPNGAIPIIGLAIPQVLLFVAALICGILVAKTLRIKLKI